MFIFGSRLAPAQTNEQKVTPTFINVGEERIREECKALGMDQRSTERFVERYNALVKQGYEKLAKELGKTRDEKLFIRKVWELLSKDFGFSFKPTNLLTDALTAKNTDCDTAAFLIFDIGRLLHIPGISIVAVKDHAFVRTQNYYLQSGNRRLFVWGAMEEAKKLYPNMYGNYSKNSEIVGLSYRAIGDELEERKDYRKAI